MWYFLNVTLPFILLINVMIALSTMILILIKWIGFDPFKKMKDIFEVER